MMRLPAFGALLLLSALPVSSLTGCGSTVGSNLDDDYASPLEPAPTNPWGRDSAGNWSQTPPARAQDSHNPPHTPAPRTPAQRAAAATRADQACARVAAAVPTRTDRPSASGAAAAARTEQPSATRAPAAAANPSADTGVGDTFAVPDFSCLEGANRETVATQNILARLFVARAEQALVSPLSDEARRWRQRVAELTQTYVEQHRLARMPVSVDDTGAPAIVEAVIAEAIRSAKQHQAEERRGILLSVDSSLDIASKSDSEIERLYSQYESQNRTVRKVNRQLGELLAKSGPRSGYTAEALLVARVDMSHFLVSTHADHLLGYSFYELLHFSNENARLARNVPLLGAMNPYAGQTEFPLSVEDLDLLSDWMEQIFQWQNEFQELLTALVGADVFRVGQKSLTEFLTGTDSRTASSLRGYPGDRKVLLFNTVLVDLTEQRNTRHELKAIIEKAFADAELTSKNGRRKTFIEGTFETNIGVNQLKKISKQLFAVIKAKQLFEEVFGEGAFLRNQADALEMFKAYKLAQLGELAGVLGVGSRSREAVYRKLDQELTRAASFNDLERASKGLLDGLLQSWSGVSFRPSAAAPPELTQAQKDELYRDQDGRVRVQVEYPGRIRHINIPALVASLKRSPNVRPEFHEMLDTFESQLVGRMGEYSRLSEDGFYGRRMVDEALTYIQAFIEKVVYSAHFRTAPESVTNAMNQLTSLVGDDVVNHCSTGLAGRFSSVLRQLSQSTGDEVRDLLTQHKQIAYQKALDATLVGQGESSMAVRRINLVFADIIGITSVAGLQASPTSMDAVQGDRDIAATLGRFAFNLNPATVYDLVATNLSERFWQLNTPEGDEAMYGFLKSYGFGADDRELDRVFRINGNRANRWQFAFFQQTLSTKLVQVLITSEVLVPLGREAAQGEVHFRGFRGASFSALAQDPTLRARAAGAAPPTVPSYDRGRGAAAAAPSVYGDAAYPARMSAYTSARSPRAPGGPAAAATAPNLTDGPGIGFPAESTLPTVREDGD